MRASAIAVVVMGCGRIGFDPLATDATGPNGDGLPACVALAQIDWAGTALPHDPSSQLAPARAYTVTADTIGESVTQLVWQRGLAPMQLTYDAAKTYCATLSLDGCAAWRLPRLIELATIVEHEQKSPTIDTVAFPNTPTDAHYWSATASTSSGDSWIVNFDNGNAFHDSNPVVNYVRCVRGGVAAQPPPARYTIGSGTVADLETGLVWEQAVDPTMRMQPEATAYCAMLPLGGATWRLPTIAELQSLADMTRVTPAIDPTAFPATPSVEFWSSTPLDGQATDGMVISFDDGTVNNAVSTDMYLTRCVH